MLGEREMEQTEEWVSLSEASIRVGIVAWKLSRIVKYGEIRVRTDPRNRRAKYVELGELRRWMAQPPQERLIDHK